MLAFVADEEAGGRKGAHCLVDNHPDLFDDCTEAISEVGGFSISLNDGPAPLRDPDRREGHQLAAAHRQRPRRPRLDGARRQRRDRCSPRAVARIGEHEFAGRHHRHRARVPRGTVARSSACDLDPDKPDEWLPLLGSAARMIGATLRNTANPTMLDAGYKVNVIPSRASATVDGRFLPGQEDDLLETIDELIGDGIEREFEVRDIAVETVFDGDLVDAMCAALEGRGRRRACRSRT